MEPTGSTVCSETPERRWLPPLLVTVVVVIGYGLAPERLPLQGEETCRAIHGIEMAASGDWLFATNQGVRIIDRPPLQYWTLALVHRWVHPLDLLTVRLVMVVTTLVTALLVWWYASRFLMAPAAVLAGVAYPTLGHVFDLGRRAETDALFALLCAASLLVWHAGHARGCNRYRTWIIAAFLAALASLTKGLQGPIAFFGATGLFLLLIRDWRWLVHPSCVAGVVTFLVTIAVWQVPFYQETGWNGVVLTWFNPATSRVDGGLVGRLIYMVTFPLMVLGATLPWSALLVGLLFKRFWAMDASVKSSVVFLLCGVASIAGPIWLSPGGHQRYALPMYPLLAVLCAVVVHQSLAPGLSEALRRLWRDYVRVLAVCVGCVVVGFLGITLWEMLQGPGSVGDLAQPLWQILLITVLIVLAAIHMVRRASSTRRRDAIAVSFLAGASLAICYNGPILNVQGRVAVDVGSAVTRLHEQIPDSAPLVSIGPIHHRFLYHYPDTIAIVRRPWSADQVPEDLEYFVIEARRGEILDLPFAWDEIARLNMDRNKSDDPNSLVIAGRRQRGG